MPSYSRLITASDLLLVEYLRVATLLKRLPFLVFIITAAIGLGLSLATYRSGVRANYLRFERFADDAVDRISRRITQHISLLMATRSLFAAQGGDVSYHQFSSYVRHLNINVLFGGIQGIGYSAVLPPEGDEWVHSVLLANYRIDRKPFPQSSEDVRTAVVMLEPSDERNRATLGYDMYSEPVRREAMQAAILNGEARASRVVSLGEQTGSSNQVGFVVFLPLFAPNEELETTQGNSTPEVLGFIFAPFQMDDLVAAALEYATWLPVQLEIHDGISEERPLLFKSQDASNSFGDEFVVRRSVEIAGRQWSFVIWPSQKFTKGRETGIALLLGAVSLLMAAAVAVSMRAQFNALEASREVLKVTQTAASQKDFLLQEMKHRIKNSIARVLAIARQTANHSANLDEFTDSFTNRLQAMATSQDLLARSHGEKADLAELLEGELQQVFGDDFKGSSNSGPKHQLGIRSTQALALVFHELATNALKYANIDEHGSRLDIRWKTGASAQDLTLDWRERLAKSDPNRENGDTTGGFGTLLMRSLVENELSGKFESRITPEGLWVRIEVPNTML